MTEVIGKYEKIRRVSTGLYSMDRALQNQVTGEIGFPVKTLTELYGNPGIGKSTLSYYLMGEIARQVNEAGHLVLCDFEGLDISHLPLALSTGGYSGKVHLVEVLDAKGKAKSHEDMIDEFIAMMDEKDNVCGMVDSIGAITPIAEVESGVAEGFGAKRAVVVARFIRKINTVVQESPTPKSIFLTNHVHTVVGGVGHSTTGGDQLKFAAATRIYLYNSSKDTIKSGDEILANVIVGKVEKLKFGGKGRDFKFVICAGRGVRPNLSAVQDCVDLELATRGAVVKIGEKSMGRISEIVQKDIEGDVEFFKPFKDALKGAGK